MAPITTGSVAAQAKANARPTTQVAGINVPPAQTWNYLHINDTSFEVPTVSSKGAVYQALSALLGDLRTGLGPQADAWAQGAAKDARYVEVRRGATADPIVVTVNASMSEAANCGVLVREGATAHVVVAVTDRAIETERRYDLAATDAPAHTSAALVRIVVERGAEVRLTEVVAANDDCQHLEGVALQVHDGAHVEVRQYALGGAKVAFGLDADLVGAHSSLDLTMRYRAGGRELLDVNHVVRQRGRGSRSNLAASGLLAGAAHKTMRETIDLVHGAKGAKGNELETVLVTGDDVVNKTLPTITCDEEDVAGNHGATIGSIGPDQLAYLAKAGLSADDAAALFERAIFDDAVIHAQVPVARDAAIDRAVELLGAEVAYDLSEAFDQSDGTTAPTAQGHSTRQSEEGTHA